MAGNFKLKPLLVYPSENLRALKGCSKPNLPMLWCFHKKAWVTMSLFQEWFVHFCLAVERYCAQHGPQHKVLLILDSVPGHPDNLVDLSDHMRVEYLPQNTTALIQPMNHDVVATFKEARAGGTHAQSAVLDFWRDYTILDAMYNISQC